MANVESQRAAVAQAKFGEMVERGRARAMKGVEAINAEYLSRHDYRVKPTGFDVKVTPAKEITVEVKSHGEFTLTPHAQGQLLDAAAVPPRFVETLSRHDLGDLLQLNLRSLLPKVSPDGLLVREVKGRVKGILSPSYRIMDVCPMFEAFITQSMRAGLVPHAGEVTDTRAFMEFLVPRVIEIMPGEHVVFGAQLRGSDYGNGALDLALSIWRLLCSNGAIGTSMFRKVHLGRRFEDFGESNVVKLSQATIELDTKTIASALQDAMKALPGQIDAQVEAVRGAADKEVNLTQVLDKLGKGGLKKATLEKVRATYENMALPVEALPQSAGAWRLSNVLSLLANDAQGDEAQDLRMTAFGLLNPKAAA